MNIDENKTISHRYYLYIVDQLQRFYKLADDRQHVYLYFSDQISRRRQKDELHHGPTDTKTSIISRPLPHKKVVNVQSDEYFQISPSK